MSSQNVRYMLVGNNKLIKTEIEPLLMGPVSIDEAMGRVWMHDWFKTE